MSVKKMNKEKNNVKRYLSFTPFFLIAFAIPVIMFPVATRFNREMSGFLLSAGEHTDYYQLAKVIVLYAAVTLMIPVTVINGRKRFPLMFAILIPVYICLFLSSYMSDYKVSSFFGIYDHYEGFLTRTCYLLILVFSYALCSGTDFVYRVIKTVLWAGVFVAAAGILQYSGIWPFTTEESYAITSTIGNSNYVGTYSVILFPLSLAMLLVEEKFSDSVISLLLFCGSSFFLVAGSLSRAAYIAFFVIIILFFIILRKEIRNKPAWLSAAAVYGVLLSVTMNACSGNSVINELKSMNPLNSSSGDRPVFEEIKLGTDTAGISTDKWQLIVEFTDDGYVFRNESGKEIPVQTDEENNSAGIGGPYNIQVYFQQKEKIKWLMLKMGRKDIELVYTGNSVKVVGFNGRLTDIEPVECIKLPFGESFASGRGYIWSRTLPLLKNTVFTGYGPDTFVYVFPQNDITGKLNYGAIWTVIAGPHNWYLQEATGSGLISLVCLLIFFGWYGINVIKDNRNPDGKKRILSAGILLAVTGYLTAGIFNDSVVSVSPVFWMLLGAGTALNIPAGTNTDSKSGVLE